MLAREQAEPTAESIIRAKRLFRYVIGTIEFGLIYKRESNLKNIAKIIAYSHSDFAGSEASPNVKDSRSTTGKLTL
jgi:hypothetical protein